jgi:ankyrin repeat protein
LDAALIRNRDENGKLPIHIACRTNAPVDVLDLILKQDAATLLITDYTGALPIHDSCHGAVDYSSVRFLVEQGGDGSLAARNHHGALPLHFLCGSTNPSLSLVQFFIQSFPESVAAQTIAGQYPFMIAACKSSTASLSVVYELARVNPDVVIPK